jgi:hypothetical protein
MNRKLKNTAALLLVGMLAAVASVSGSVASAKWQKPAPAAPADAVLAWNTNAVNAVRASSPSKFQVEGLISLSYVQAAVYDALTKLAGRYVPYHDFAATVVPGASLDAAVAAAADTIVEHYLPDRAAAVNAGLLVNDGGGPTRNCEALSSRNGRIVATHGVCALCAGACSCHCPGRIGPIVPYTGVAALRPSPVRSAMMSLAAAWPTDTPSTTSPERPSM